MASNTTYGDWMRPMPGGIRNIGIPLTIAGMGVLTCTLLVSMASVVAAIAILVVGMGVILVLAIRDREHRNMVDRAVEKRTWMAAQRTGANLYRSGLLAPIDGGKAMLPGILSRVVLTSALDGLGREFCLVRHAHTGEYSLLLSCQPQGASLADDDVEDSYVASWAGLMESLASETGVTQLAVTVDTAPDSGVRFRRTLSKRIVEDAPELAARAMAQIMDQYAAGGASNDVTLTLTFRYTDRDGKYLEAGEAARRISLLLPSIREQIAQAGGGAARALGMNAIIPGDLKPDYASLVNMLGGQVIRLGAGIGVVNPLDPGDLHYALQRLEGKARKDLTDYYNDTRAALMEVLLTIMRTGREADDVGGARGVTARESDILSVAVRVLHDRHGDDPQPPVIADLRDLLREGPDEVRMAAVWDDPENDELYRAQVRGLLADLHGFSNRMTKFGRLFGDQTTARIDLSRPVDFDISALAQSGDDVVAAVLATTWTSAFAAKNAADVLAEEGLQPRRNHVIIMDEMHRALRASPLMVEKLDLLTRLNRQWGVGQIMITHTFKDLMCMETPAQNTKARGFVERSEIKVLGALSRIEVDRYLRGECGLPVSRREEAMLEHWATPVNFGSDASHKGLGRFLIKLGGLPGIPINVEMCPLEKSGFNDTNLKWHA